jgi:phosphatidylserine/phosphatidylglycerophosphate/cardiolipin synthase-like enzyme
MTKKSSTKKQRTTSNQTVTLIILVVLLIMWGIYALTGSDPTGLFTPTEPTPPPPAMVGSGGDWWQVYFTSPQGNKNPDNLSNSIPEKLIQHINNAQTSIYIAAFEFNLTPVADALIAAHNRGVEVRWVTDDEYGLEADEEDDHGQFVMLEAAGIEVKDDGRAALMHNKFLIFDKQTVWTGSTNLTSNGNFRNNNNVLVIKSPEVAQIYEREFEEMWAGEFGPTSTSTLSRQTLIIDGTPVRIFFAPEDKVISQLLPLIESAQNNIRFMAFSFTHDDLGHALLERVQAGVDVSGIFETRGSETEYSQMTRFYCAGMPVLQDGNPGTFHHKVFIIDDKIVVTGSLNFSENADQSNDENVIVVSNHDIAAQYRQEFERRWVEGTPPKNIQCAN